MKRFLKITKWAFGSLLALVLIFLSWFWIKYGGSGITFNYKPTEALWPTDSMQIVATLPEPPGNIAISHDGRIFCTYHAEGRPKTKVWELVNGKPVAFPNEKWQSSANGDVYLDAIFNIRIDAKNRLWTLDHGQNGFKQPRLLCFDINTRQLVTQIDIPKTICGIGSYVQDMNIDTACEKIYIADLSAFGKTPAIVIADIASKKCRRVLVKDKSVIPDGNYSVVNKGREMKPVGPLYHFHPAVDPIAIDRKNEWLYYGPMSGEWMYRIKIADINNESLSGDALSKKVEQYAKKPQCDGITTDDANNIYVTSIEDGAIAVIDSSKQLKTLVTHPKMRWPDGLSFGPDGYVYVADSDIPDVMMKSKGHMKENAPYYIFKFKGLSTARAGQ
jgi:sugar lactone lactonase YvrE